MKKIIIVLFIFVVMILGGCYSDKTKKDMEVFDIKVYDEFDNEVIGTIRDYYRGISKISTRNVITKENLNSAAPVINYYFIPRELNKSYKIYFYLRSENNYELTKLSLINELFTHYPEQKIDILDIKKEDDYFIATLSIDKIDETNQLFTVYQWESENKIQKFGRQGNNTYLSGVYFYIPEETDI